MNTIESKIVKIHDEFDVTSEFRKRTHIEPEEELYKVDMTIDSYGCVERVSKMMWKSDLEKAKKLGYFIS